ncbi:MAG: hypothetical protein ABI563_17590 [Specibacter sp.]
MAQLIASVDEGAGTSTDEILAVAMGAGNVGAKSSEDLINVFTQAVAQLRDSF